ncbi:cytochrome P450 [Nonomuraea sp. NPDC049400]|uniref:cytochrome P450 n=1 Tax=Nonomuraea sp. NPDC049400 TaxID=3364352 RepID=UPI0037A4B334
MMGTATPPDAWDDHPAEGTAAFLDIDLAAALRHPDLEALAARLHAAGPVVRVPYPAGGEIWVVTDPQLAREVLADPRLAKDAALAPPHWTEVFSVLGTRSNPHPGLIAVEGERHRRLRGVHAPAFTRRRIQALEPAIQATCDQHFDRLAAVDRPIADAVTEFCYPFPLSVICDVLGVPEELRPDLAQASEDMAYGADHAVRRAGRRLIYRRVEEAVASKAVNPADDLITALLAVRDDDSARLTSEELPAAITGLIFAGHETTAGLLAALLLKVLVDPDAKDAARTDAGAAALVEQTLRSYPPSPNTTWRFAAEPLTIGGFHVPAGAAVLVSIVAVNHCPAAGHDRGRRERVEHLSFSFGPHYCIGAELARAEARIAVRTFVERFPRARLGVAESELIWDSSLLLRRMRSLPIRVSTAAPRTPAAAAAAASPSVTD